MENHSEYFDLEFENLNYFIKGRGVEKHLLKSVNGKFCSGELIGVLGSSGSGKTTLLNILAGYTTNEVSGTITVGGKPRQMQNFHKMCTYIMQEDVLQPHLSVKESLLIAIDLKIGNKFNHKNKIAMMDEVLRTLKLENCIETRTESLSGGERKRLSLALELVSNPPIIFLDEPTSGLDTVAIKQCMAVLKKLTNQGKMVICTIHQPSVSTFQEFHQVYFIADGMCVYNGSTSNLLPFLTSVGLECPVTYSPEEFIIEMSQTDSEVVQILVEATENGRICNRQTEQLSISSTSALSNEQNSTGEDMELRKWSNIEFATSFWIQTYILLKRMFLQARRNTARIWIQLFYHSMIGITFGILFFGVGNNAELAMANFKFYTFTTFFFTYSHIMSPVLLFPLELELLKREYFNRWYGLKAYFLALSLRNIPETVFFGFSTISVTYLMTDQPLEFGRFSLFAAVFFLIGFASEGLGLAIGSTFSITAGSVAAPGISAPSLFLCIYGMGYGSSIQPYMKIIMGTSYLRYGLVAVHLIMLNNRPLFNCSDDMLFCFYKDPKHILRDMGMLGNSLTLQIIGLCAFATLFRLIAFLALKYRLSSEFSPKIKNWVTKILQYS